MPLLLRLAALAAICPLIFSCEPLVTTFDNDDELIIYYEADPIVEVTTPPENLRILTWNVKYAGGGLNFFYDCYDKRVLMTKTEVLENLGRLADKIIQLDPDIILIQEIEIGSKRSAYVDQMQYLLNETALNYGVYSSLWKAQYIPSDGLGRMDMGNAILSKFELTDAERIAFELRTDQDALTQYFYLRRNIVRATAHVGSGLEVINTHTSAYSQDGSKEKQLIVFKDLLDQINADSLNFVAGGDLNTIPPNADKKNNFSDSICEDEDFVGDDYREETDWLRPLYRDYYPAIDTLVYATDEAAYFTHTVNSADDQTRKLDYLFTNIEGGWDEKFSKVHNRSEMNYDRARISDHAPVSAILVLPQGVQ
ncbi:endonuclease/exonuclease/phosphatase family protein [Candidatus Neomarinimicrobiota bacterium]